MESTVKLMRFDEIITKADCVQISREEVEGFVKDNLNVDEEYNFLLHKTYEVLIGKVESGKFIFYDPKTKLDLEHLIELRIFKEDFELHIIKMDDKYICRVRVDVDGVAGDLDGYEKVEVYDEVHAIFGTDVEEGKNNKEWSLLKEERGINIYVPFKVSSFKKETNTKLYYQVRNYIEKDAPLKFIDARLVKFTFTEEGMFDERGEYHV